MGALHEGHLALIASAKAQCGTVAASIFVNPLQFNNLEDLEKYPRQPERDQAMLEDAGCDMLFCPSAQDIYHNFTARTYDLGGLDGILEGASRPGHFQGVVNVVERLFHYVRPNSAFFGEKDRQQLAVIRHVARQQHWPLQVIGLPTLRSVDGLALSSRNQRLTADERALAPLLHQALQVVAAMAFKHPVSEAQRAGTSLIESQKAFTLDYLSIADPATLRQLADWQGLDEAVALVAAHLGPVRLIDNITLRR